MSGGAGARVAVYYAPELHDPLWTAGNSWLGRDPETGATLPPAGDTGIPTLTNEPALYGLHATLKPPMRLSAAGRFEDVLGAVAALAAQHTAFPLPQLAVTNFDGFLALCPETPSAALQSLADAAVARLDGFRAPPEESELARRRRHELSPAEEQMLQRWGYPYVFSLWRFHITLSRRLAPDEMAIARPRAERHFTHALRHRREVGSLAVFTQRGAGQPFLLARRFPLSRSAG